jgi:hypothetical protein
MKGVMSTLRGQLAGEGAAWGRFATGANAMSGQLNWVNGSMDAKTTLPAHYSDTLTQAANSCALFDHGWRRAR